MISTTDLMWLSHAKKFAARSQSRHRMGAVLIRGGRFLAGSPNIGRNNPAVIDCIYCSWHCEVATLRRVADPSRGVMYIARLMGSGDCGLAMPCNNCFEVLDKTNIKRAIWTTNVSYDSIRF